VRGSACRLDGRAGDQLGFWACYENACCARNVDVSKPGYTGQVLQRFALCPAGHQIVIPVWDGGAADHRGLHSAAGHPEQRGGEFFGVDAGGRDPAAASWSVAADTAAARSCSATG
jgi:hypothetical protein